MRNLVALLGVISVGALSPTFAADPPAAPATSSTSTATTSTPSATSASATTEPSAADKAPANSTTADGKVKLVAGDVEADKQLKRLKAAGYKPEMHGSEVFFCRREAVLGSRFEKKVCNTADALDQQMVTAQELASQAQRNSTISPRSN